jgi:CHASE3 domain sensor protein
MIRPIIDITSLHVLSELKPSIRDRQQLIQIIARVVIIVCLIIIIIIIIIIRLLLFSTCNFNLC